jgi:hypothetical protein
MKRLYSLNPLVKKNSVEDHHQLKQPQYSGTPGWIFLTHNEDSSPIALFADQHQKLTVIYLVLDERLFSDTILRVVRVGPTRFIVYDIRYLNGLDIYSTYSFHQRKERLETLLSLFHHPDLVSLELVDNIQSTEFPIRGYEYYDDKPGTLGVFLPIKE